MRKVENYYEPHCIQQKTQVLEKQGTMGLDKVTDNLNDHVFVCFT